ncbi:MAG TPA: septum site-determining protein MinC [Steroidobacteraceae bacterium]
MNLSPRRPAAASIPLAVDIRYGQIGLMQLRIRTTDTGALLDELTGRMNTAPNFFRRTAVCIDLSDLEKAPETQEIKAILDAVRRAGLLAVGLASASAEIEALANAVNLPILSAFRPASHSVAAVESAQRVATEPAAAEAGIAAMIQQQTVRSGQRIYARNRDLVITAGVGAGAEVIADGCVHIYGSLRGRAMAGAHGQLNARVFCQEFHAELISIGGVFRVFETIPSDLAGKPVQAWLDGEDLLFAPVGG